MNNTESVSLFSQIKATPRRGRDTPGAYRDLMRALNGFDGIAATMYTGPRAVGRPPSVFFVIRPDASGVRALEFIAATARELSVTGTRITISVSGNVGNEPGRGPDFFVHAQTEADLGQFARELASTAARYYQPSDTEPAYASQETP